MSFDNKKLFAVELKFNKGNVDFIKVISKTLNC